MTPYRIKMADKKSYIENKLALTVAKGQLTKSLNKFEKSCKDLSSMPDNLPVASNVSLCILWDNTSIVVLEGVK